MSHAAEFDTMSARRALSSALNALDKGNPTAAEAWAETAAQIIREGALSPAQQRQLVAPHDGPTVGDKIIMAVSGVVIVLLIIDIAFGLLP